jgi:hypothetical protein
MNRKIVSNTERKLQAAAEKSSSAVAGGRLHLFHKMKPTISKSVSGILCFGDL